MGNPLSAFSFPTLFSGLLDDVSGDSEQPAQPPTDKDRKAKEHPTAIPIAVAVVPPLPPPAPLPFLLSLQIPQIPQVPTDVATGNQAPDTKSNSLQLSGPVVAFRKTADSKIEMQPDRQPAVQAIPLPLDPPSAPRLTPPMPSVVEAAPVPQVAPEAPVRIEPDRPTSTGSAWKETASKLPNTELAFAARVLQTPDSNDRPQSSESDMPTAHTGLPLAKAQASEPQRDTSQQQQQQQQQPDSKPEPPTTTRTATPITARQVPHETERDSGTAPTPIAAPTEGTGPTPPTPIATGAESVQPSKAPETPHHVPQTAETHLPEPPAVAPGPPIRDFSMRLNSHDQDIVEVKVVQSAGEIRVAVHSADSALTTSLQQGISELVGKLESKGMHAETWKPTGEATPATPTARSETSQNNQQQFSGQGHHERHSRQQQSPQQRRGNKPDWLQEIDGTLETLPFEIVRKTA